MISAAVARLGRGVLALSLFALVGWPLIDLALRLSHGTEGMKSSAVDIARPWSLAWQSLEVVAFTEALALPAGVLLALLFERTALPGRRLARGAVLLGLFIPLPLHAILWLGAFGNQGRQQVLGSSPWLVGLFGAAWVHAMAALPWVVLIVGVGLRTVEPELEELGLMRWPAWRVIVSITLRRASWSIAAAALTVAVMCAGDMTVADLIPLRTYAEEAYTLAQQGGPLEFVAVRTTLPLVLVLGGLMAALSVGTARRHATRLAALASPARSWFLGRARVPICILTWCCILIFIGLPLYGLVWRAGRVGAGLVAGAGARWTAGGLAGTLANAWSDLVPPWSDVLRGDVGLDQTPLAGSFLWSSLAALGATTLALGLAWEARTSRTWRLVTLAVVILLLATPAPVLGVVFKLAYARVRWLGATPGLLVLGLTARMFPFALLIVWPAVVTIPDEYLELAAVAGYTPPAQFWRIVLPSTRRAFVISWLLTMALALGELPTSYMLQAPGYELISVLTWTLLHNGVESRLSGVTLWLLALLVIVGLCAGTLFAPHHRGSRENQPLNAGRAAG